MSKTLGHGSEENRSITVLYHSRMPLKFRCQWSKGAYLGLNRFGNWFEDAQRQLKWLLFLLSDPKLFKKFLVYWPHRMVRVGHNRDWHSFANSVKLLLLAYLGDFGGLSLSKLYFWRPSQSRHICIVMGFAQYLLLYRLHNFGSFRHVRYYNRRFRSVLSALI